MTEHTKRLRVARGQLELLPPRNELRRDLFIASEQPAAVGERLELTLQIEGRDIGLGEVTVLRHGAVAGYAGYFVELSRPLPFELLEQVQRAGPADGTWDQAAKESEAGEDSEPWSGGLQPFDLLGRYQLLRRLGHGGMGEVFLARCASGQGVEKLVALKVVLPEYGLGTPLGALCLNEARISMTLQHPNVIQVFDFGEAAGRPFLAMEHIHGRNLDHVVRRLRERAAHSVLSFAVAVGIELCRALEYVHEKRGLDGRPLNLVHRDLSPRNVLLSYRGEVKVWTSGWPRRMLFRRRRRCSWGSRRTWPRSRPWEPSPPLPGTSTRWA